MATTLTTPEGSASLDATTLGVYRSAIRSIILEYAQYKPSNGDIEVETVFDEGNDHYELIHAGWAGDYRVHGPVIHVDIRHDKVWIQHDGTRDGIIDALIEHGIPQDKIVLAYKHPEDRPNITGFALR